ncbi:MAG: hypothetical protein PVH74_02620 [Desulfobacterales bacterium]|nr:hypothetical protein [Deltaproteobacteria bacterium]
MSVAYENQKKREWPVAKNVGRLSLGSKRYYFWTNDGFDDNRLICCWAAVSIVEYYRLHGLYVAGFAK